MYNLTENNIIVDVFGDTAMATIEYNIDYEINNKRYLEDGKEVMAFIKKKNKWLLHWRMLIATES